MRQQRALAGLAGGRQSLHLDERDIQLTGNMRTDGKTAGKRQLAADLHPTVVEVQGNKSPNI